MRAHPVVWFLRALWLSLPLTVGDSIARAVDGRSTAVSLVAVVGAWALWGAVLAATLVPHPVSLTILRWLAPTAPAAALALTFVDAPGQNGAAAGAHALGLAGLATAIAATAAAWSAPVADEFVDGASYGDERRFALRTPPAFLVGPLPVFWALVVGGLSVGPLLLAAGAWLPGAMTTLVGASLAIPAARGAHALARRWLVFVPAGVTLVDHLGLIDPVLFPRGRVAALRPALAERVNADPAEATDLTQDALGLALELTFDGPVEIVARTGASAGETRLTRAVLVAPLRPGAVVEEATRRGLVTGHAAVPPPTTSSPS